MTRLASWCRVSRKTTCALPQVGICCDAEVHIYCGRTTKYGVANMPFYAKGECRLAGTLLVGHQQTFSLETQFSCSDIETTAVWAATH